MGVPGSLLEVSWKVSRFRLLRSLKLGRSTNTKHRLRIAPPPFPPPPVYSIVGRRLLHRQPLPPAPPSSSRRRSLFRIQAATIAVIVLPSQSHCQAAVKPLPQRCMLLGRQILLIWRQRLLVRSWDFLGSSSSLGELHHIPSLVVLAIPSGTVSGS